MQTSIYIFIRGMNEIIFHARIYEGKFAGLFNSVYTKEDFMDEQSRKTALRMISYGMYILTSKFEDDYCAATVTWVSQASFDPTLISVCIKGDSASYAVVKGRGEFLLQLLGDDQKDLADSFFKPTIPENGFINGQKYQLQDDLPLLMAVPAYIKCSVLEILEKGDHPLFLAEVIDAVINEESKPLELRKTDWSYGG